MTDVNRSARLRVANMTLSDALALAKGWIDDSEWLPSSDLKAVLQRLVAATEEHSRIGMPAPELRAEKRHEPVSLITGTVTERPPELTCTTQAKRKPGRPRKLVEAAAHQHSQINRSEFTHQAHVLDLNGNGDYDARMMNVEGIWIDEHGRSFDGNQHGYQLGELYDWRLDLSTLRAL